MMDLAIDLGAGDIKLVNEVYPYIKQNNLIPLIVAFLKSVESLSDTLKMAKDFGSHLSIYPNLADKAGMSIRIKTHRNCITND